MQRDLAQTQSLVDAAFKLLKPPTASAIDGFTSQRRKWDILRITLGTTIYGSPPISPTSSKPLKREKELLYSPTEFVESLRDRSLRLFTPATHKPTSTFVPPQIVLLLAVSAVKLDTLQLARETVEDWLARRTEETQMEAEAYEKIVEVYCLHVLSRLGLWEDAREFLNYESELHPLIKDVRDI